METEELFSEIRNCGFDLDQYTWKSKDEKGLGYYSFAKGTNKIEVKTDWCNRYTHYPKLHISFIDQSNAFHCTGGYTGWMGNKVLGMFEKPISKELFLQLINHYEF